MCLDPVTMFGISMGISALTTVTQLAAQNQQYSAQQQQRNEQIRLQRQQRNEQLRGLQERRLQETRASSEEMAENARQAREARSTALTAAGESGAFGISVNALLGDITRREAEFANTTIRNLDYTQAQLGNEMTAANLNYQTGMNALPRPTRPSYLDAALRLGADAFSSYSTFLRAPNPGAEGNVAAKVAPGT